VSFSTTFTSSAWKRPAVRRSRLQFLDVDAVSSFLSDAGFAIAAQFEDWDRQELTPTSPEIITIAGRGERGLAIPSRLLPRLLPKDP
jgi:hypothetical protein